MMASHKLSLGLFASAAFVSLAAARSSPPVAAAATTVSPDSSNGGGFPLFDAERVQVTEEVLEKIRKNEDSASVRAKEFAFDDASAKKDKSGSCKVLPGDKSWPSDDIWNFFDGLLGGALEPVVPIASACYKKSEYDNYDAKECAALVSNFTVPETHTEDPGSMMFPIFEGRTCLPTDDPDGSCTQGGHVSYAVDVSNVAQIQMALIFSRLFNVRLVIRNTGHDYNGRSTGAGALSLWTHHLKDIDFQKDYKGAGYEGPAMKVAAGAQGFEVYDAADKYGVSVLGGLCPSVGFAGGYITGGGHSPLMSLYGMAADQLLAVEVVTADGRFVTATPDNDNSDLFWALSGGGGGTFGVITSVVVKAYPKISVTTSMISFGDSDEVSTEAFWQGVQAYWDNFLPYIDAKTYSYFWITNTSGVHNFAMTPFYAPHHTIDEFNKLVKPWFDRMHELGIPFEANTTYHDNFLSSYDATFNTQDWGVGGWSSVPGVRLLPRDVWEDDKTRDATFEVVKDVVETHGSVGGYHQHPKTPEKIQTSVNTHFRNEVAFLILSTKVSEDATTQELHEAGQTLTFDVIKRFRDLSPTGGAYANEADVNEQDWQESFWGENYPRLLKIKKKVDPRGLFYVHHGVGSEQYEVRDGDGGVQTQNGRLCRI